MTRGRIVHCLFLKFIYFCSLSNSECSFWCSIVHEWHLFFLISGNMYKTLRDWNHVIHAVKWSPDETLLCAVGPFELVILYDTESWEQLFKLEGHLNRVVDCAFSSDRYGTKDSRSLSSTLVFQCPSSYRVSWHASFTLVHYDRWTPQTVCS